MKQDLPFKTDDELFHESINMLPRKTQMLIKAYAIKQSTDYKDFNPKLWLATAISWWTLIRENLFKVGITEEEAADLLLTELKKQEFYKEQFENDPLAKETLQ